MKNDHRQFLYQNGVETARLFEEGEEIPEGWTDLPDSDEWDNPPVGYVRPVVDESHERPSFSEMDPPKKYPSQMNKEELVDFGTGIGLDLYGMTKREMLEAINGKIKEGERDDGVSKE